MNAPATLAQVRPDHGTVRADDLVSLELITETRELRYHEPRFEPGVDRMGRAIISTATASRRR